MANGNDQRILQLKEQIKAKKEKLDKSVKFSPVTNCSIEIDGVRYNLQTLNKEQSISLLVKLNSYFLSAEHLNIVESYVLSGYNIKDWIADLESRINILSRKEEEQTLKSMENKLTQLLSEDKKVELELNDIEKMLKG